MVIITCIFAVLVLVALLAFVGLRPNANAPQFARKPHPAPPAQDHRAPDPD